MFNAKTENFPTNLNPGDCPSVNVHQVHVSEWLGLPVGHKGLDFVDVKINSDTELFIDPCLVESGTDAESRRAAVTIGDFEDVLFREMRSDRWCTTEILDRAHEIHETKLGYGNGRNGRGTTSEGLRYSLEGLRRLANHVPTIGRIQDINVLVRDFAEDRMSDLLTNVLRGQLCDFTSRQMAMYGKEPAGYQKISCWSSELHQWVLEEKPYWEIDGVQILLVPKHWVRARYLFNAHQYLFSVIIQRMREREGYSGLSKEDVWKSLERRTVHWEYDRVISYTQENPEALTDYHRAMLQYYERSYGPMSDEELNLATYGKPLEDIA